MGTVSVITGKSLGGVFIPDEYLVKGEDEYFFRNSQIPWKNVSWRRLTSDEVERLVKNNNTAEDWDRILVTDEFDTGQIRNNDFYGFIRIKGIRNAILEFHEQRLPVGITNSVIISCDIGCDVAIHNVPYLSHYIIGNNCILTNIDEMHVSNHVKFGNGIVKDGEPENVRIWIDLMNETGCRKILPSDRIIPADAYLWAKYRDDGALQKRLFEITQNSYDAHRGYYGLVGDNCVIKNSRILKDVQIGSHCYIKGANKLKNLTIKSSEDEPTQIGEGVELVNGIIGYGCKVFYGCKAVRFMLGDNSSLKYGARLINSYLGDNSTISCCEVLNNLIFPAHEQHHNNSFLISSVIMGQSNMAAGCTIGSNHNSRANDSELVAGRGFWPGLCSSVKHSCRFASFVLLSKADYPYELNISLPFSLLNNNAALDHLEIYPGFWWLHDMYALERNSSKFRKRDTRTQKIQNIEFDALAPDTIEEIIAALRLLEIWTGKAALKREGSYSGKESDRVLSDHGQALMNGNPEDIEGLEVIGENMEKSRRKVIILSPYKAYRAYNEMLHIYAIRNLVQYLEENTRANAQVLLENIKSERVELWTNLGGQLVPSAEVDRLRKDIGSGSLDNWEAIHARYEELWEVYPREKQKHAYAVLCLLYGTDTLSDTDLEDALEKAVQIQEYINKQVYDSRKKDYDNPFRQTTFRNKTEMDATIGTVDNNDFVRQVKTQTEEFSARILTLLERLK